MLGWVSVAGIISHPKLEPTDCIFESSNHSIPDSEAIITAKYDSGYESQFSSCLTPPYSGDKTTERDPQAIYLLAWTPGGIGLATRTPALIPGAIMRRGHRMFMMREFAGIQG
ncbi:unnamed protein product [Protopolystoma xenopodis]|uniref:Uncharacterized protein n=1 Tax=Protopolystoma xenopodis TaxID=117903 RepID=A0A3S5A6G5_9PLAT|nr:unnamed protein product [Protopolystoma xenopodis]